MDSNHIKRLLRAKHADDVFVDECKVGESQTRHCPRFDAWAMEKSWAHPRMVGYEVKVARSDFLADKKWPSYLPYCNEFCFVCPNGLIQPEELPDNIGLIYVSNTGSKLYTKRKAPYRVLEKQPVDLLKYILMNRVRIKPSGVDGMTNRQRAEAVLAEQAADIHLGQLVSAAVRKRWADVAAQARQAAQDRAFAEEIAEELKRLDVTGRNQWEIRAKLKRLHPELDFAGNVRQLERMRDSIASMVTTVQAMDDAIKGVIKDE